MKRRVGSVIVGTVPNEEVVPPIRAIISIKVFSAFCPLALASKNYSEVRFVEYIVFPSDHCFPFSSTIKLKGFRQV